MLWKDCVKEKREEKKDKLKINRFKNTPPNFTPCDTTHNVTNMSLTYSIHFIYTKAPTTGACKNHMAPDHTGRYSRVFHHVNFHCSDAVLYFLTATDKLIL